MNQKLQKKGIRNIILPLLMLLLLQTGGCTTASRVKQAEGGKDEAVIHVLVTTSSWTRNIEEIEMFRDLSKKTGVKIIWEQVRSGWDEQKNAMLSSGNVPDVFLGGAITDADIAAYPELFLPMNKLIKEDAPNVQRMFQEKPDTLKLALFTDGNIYGLPSVKFHRPDSTSMLIINREWLEKLGLSKPETLEDFKNVLIAFRDGDPNENGKADEIPFDFANSRNLFSAMNLIGAYGNYAEDFSGEWFGMKDGKVKFLPITEDYYKLVIYLHELFSEGLINQNVFSQDYSQFQQKAKMSSNMMVGATLGWSIEDRVGTAYESSYEVLLPLQADEKIAAFWPSHAARCKYETNRVVITTSNPYPKETMKWINEMYGEEFSVQAIYGSFGVGVEKTVDGYAVLPAPDGKTADEWKWINSLGGNAACYASDELDQLLVPPVSIAKTLEQYEQYEPYFQAEEDILPRLKFTKEEADQLAIIKSGIYKLVDEKWIKWITVGGIEEEWEDYLNQMHLLGADSMLAIYQKELEFYKTGRKE